MGKLQFRRGSNNERAVVTFDPGEPVWVTDTDDFYIGDGSTAGGILIKASPTTSDYSTYVATSALGATAGGSGRAITTGTADGTTANKLIDSGAAFTSALYLNKTVYNATDDTWAKITAVDSATTLSLSADIFVSGEDYETCAAVTTIPLGLGKVENPFQANVVVRISPGTFTDDFEVVGINPSGAFTLTLTGSSTTTTTVSGEVTTRQRFDFSDVTFTKRIFMYSGTDIVWTTCVTSGDDGFIINNAPNVTANTFASTSVVTFESDPGTFTNSSSTVNIGYTKYVATSTFQGDDGNDGLLITQGSATSTSANKLVDSTANFNDADHLSMTVYNSTDDTWAKVQTVDSTTQITLSVDIMASGENYVIAAAKLTIQDAIDTIPGAVNSDTIVKISNGTFSEDVIIRGKQYSGSFSITVNGTLTLQETVTSATVAAGTGATQGTVTKAAAFTSDAYSNFLCYFVTDGVYRLIDSHTNDILTLVGTAASSTTQNISVYSWGTIVSGTGITIEVSSGQQDIILNDLDLTTSAVGALNVTSKATVTVNRCTCDKWFQTITGSSLSIAITYMSWSVIDRIINASSSDLTVSQSKLHTGTVNKLGVAAEAGCNVTFVNGSIMSGAGTASASVGLQGLTGTNYNFFSVAASGYPRVRDWDTGLKVGSGSQAIFTQTSGAPHVVYSGNTTDRTENTAKSAHYTDTL